MIMVGHDIVHCTLSHAQEMAHTVLPHAACHAMQVQIWML